MSGWQKPDALLEEETSDGDDLEHLIPSVILRFVVESTEHEDRVTVFEMIMFNIKQSKQSLWYHDN